MRPGLVPTINVNVDDETGRACATKADGRYRCWIDDSFPLLPEDDYVQVQGGREGPIGLTRDGRIRAVGITVPPDLAPVIELHSTNMWGYRTLCYRTSVEGPLTLFFAHNIDVGADQPDARFGEIPGPFKQAFCAYEGLVAGVRPDGSAYEGIRPALGGSWRQVALSPTIACGVRPDGEVSCAPGGLGGQSNATPSFPPGPYAQVAVNWKVACALTVASELRCLRFDNKVIPTPSGHYTSIAAGWDVVCALRAEGTSACWRHDGGPPNFMAPTRLDPIVPAVDADW